MYNVDEDTWLRAMSQAATGAIALAAGQMGDPDAAAEWRRGRMRLCFDRPDTFRADLSFSRATLPGEPHGAGDEALVLDYRPYVHLPETRPNPLVDAGVRAAVLRQVRGRMRVAELARLSPGAVRPAWASTLDVLTWQVLSHFLTQTEIEEIVSSSPPVPAGPDDHPSNAVERNWRPYGSPSSGLLHCHLVPDMGTIATDGLEFRLGPAGGIKVRVESDPMRGHVHVEIHGVNLPETAIANAEGRPLSRLVDDPALRPATELLAVRSVSNHVQGDAGILSIVCDEVRIRCAPAPEGATFAWERLRDPAAPVPRAVRVLDHGTLGG